MTSYVVQVVIEPDEDVWRAYVPELESRGAATWGQTRDEALRNIQANHGDVLLSTEFLTKLGLDS